MFYRIELILSPEFKLKFVAFEFKWNFYIEFYYSTHFYLHIFKHKSFTFNLFLSNFFFVAKSKMHVCNES